MIQFKIYHFYFWLGQTSLFFELCSEFTYSIYEVYLIQRCKPKHLSIQSNFHLQFPPLTLNEPGPLIWNLLRLPSLLQSKKWPRPFFIRLLWFRGASFLKQGESGCLRVAAWIRSEWFPIKSRISDQKLIWFKWTLFVGR